MGNIKKISLVVCAALMLAVMFLGLDNAVSAQSDQDGVVIYTEFADPENMINSRGMQKVACLWAEAVKNRDGKAQYELMSKPLQKAVYDEFSELNWVTGVSSPWVASYTVQKSGGGVSVIFHLETSAGSAGDYRQDLTFVRENGILKIDSISEPTRVDVFMQKPWLGFTDLVNLIGKTKAELLGSVGETPYPVDEGGLGFDKAGIRVWFDQKTYNKVAQVLIMTNAIDINGVRLGDNINQFKKVFGEPISDQNGDAHFKYGNVYLSVAYDTATGKTVGVYILAENF